MTPDVPRKSDARRARDLFAEVDPLLDGDLVLAGRVAEALRKAREEPKRSNRRAPALIDPFVLFRQNAADLRPALENLDVEQLKDVVSQYAMDSGRLALKWKTPERLIELIIGVVEQRTRKGDVFRT